MSVVVAASTNDVIGRDGDLPWHLPGDLRHFKRLTTGHVLVMGRVTHQSIIAHRGRPLDDRVTVVVTSAPPAEEHESVVFARSPREALATAREHAQAMGDGEVFIVGGSAVYEQLLPLADRVYLTRVHRVVEGDAVMPAGWLAGFEQHSRTDCSAEAGGSDHDFSFMEYWRKAG